MKKLKKPLLFFIILLIGVTAIVQLAVTPFLKKALTEKIRGSCRNCEMDIESVFFAPLYGSAEVKNVRVRIGEETTTLYEAQIEKITIQLSPKTLVFGSFHASRIRIDRPIVTITEGDAPNAAEPPSNETSDAPTFSLDATEIRDGTFQYYHLTSGRKAGLRLSEISADIGAVEARGGEKTDESVANVRALLEKSGRVKLKIGAFLFSPDPLKVSVDLEVKDLQLADVDSFFGPEEGMSLSGQLHLAESRVKIEGSTLHATTRVAYEGLNLSVKKTPERSALAAFFTNLAQKIVIDPKNTDEKKNDQKESVVLTRKSKESIVSFILRGMKDGAIGVASHL